MKKPKRREKGKSKSKTLPNKFCRNNLPLTKTITKRERLRNKKFRKRDHSFKKRRGKDKKSSTTAPNNKDGKNVFTKNVFFKH